MTKEEAIEEVKTAFDVWEWEFSTGDNWSDAHEARDMAIKALEQQPCEDCISRERLLARIDEERKHLLDLKMDGAEHIIVHYARRIIEDMPSVTPQPKRGKWIRGFGMGETYSWFYECSECGEQVKGNYCGCDYNYCPYCGSNNREEADE